jgi:hypothetical protein
MRKFLTAGLAVAMLAVPTAAQADQPRDPGCFGTNRADNLHVYFQSGGAYDTAPGASEWGAIAGERGATNGQQNRDWNVSFCGNEAHGNA